jgi:hypothetical protein
LVGFGAGTGGVGLIFHISGSPEFFLVFLSRSLMNHSGHLLTPEVASAIGFAVSAHRYWDKQTSE